MESKLKLINDIPLSTTTIIMNDDRADSKSTISLMTNDSTPCKMSTPAQVDLLTQLHNYELHVQEIEHRVSNGKSETQLREVIAAARSLLDDSWTFEGSKTDGNYSLQVPYILGSEKDQCTSLLTQLQPQPQASIESDNIISGLRSTNQKLQYALDLANQRTTKLSFDMVTIEEQIATVRRENTSLVAEIASCKDTITILEHERTQLRETISEMESKLVVKGIDSEVFEIPQRDHLGRSDSEWSDLLELADATFDEHEDVLAASAQELETAMLHRHINALTANLKTADCVLRQASQERSDVESELTKTKSQLDGMRADLAKALEVGHAYSASLEAMLQESVKMWEDKYSDLEKQNTASTKEWEARHNALSEELRVAKHQLMDVEGSYMQLKTELLKVSENLQDSAARLSEVSAERDRLLGERDSSMTQKSSEAIAMRSVAELMGKAQKMESEIVLLREELSKKTVECQEILLKSADVQSRYDSMQQTIDEKSTALQAMQQEKEILVSKMVESQQLSDSKIEELRESHDRVHAKWTGLVNIHDDLQSMVAMLTRDWDGYRENSDKDLYNARSSLQKTTSSLFELTRCKGNLEVELDTVKRRSQRAIDDLTKTMQTEIEASGKKQVELMEQVRKFTFSIQTYKAENAELCSLNRELELRVDELEQMASQTKNESVYEGIVDWDAGHTMFDIKEEIERMSTSIKTLTDANVDLSSQLTHEQQTTTLLQNTLAQAESRCIALENEMTQQRKEWTARVANIEQLFTLSIGEWKAKILALEQEFSDRVRNLEEEHSILEHMYTERLRRDRLSPNGPVSRCDAVSVKS